MSTVQSICEFLEAFAPSRLAADWDNVGLLVGDRQATVQRVMTCLTITPSSAAEAIERDADLIVTHHPLPFRPLKRVTTDDVSGRLLLQLIRGGVAVYSPHTAFDSAAAGINQRFAEGLGLEQIRPLVADDDQEEPEAGMGRFGTLTSKLTLEAFAKRLKDLLGLSQLKVVGSNDDRISRVAVACGSAGQFLDEARDANCDLLVTGETSFHTCLEAEATGIALLLTGHYASERFAVEQLAGVLTSQFEHTDCWASQRETDPLRVM